MSEDNHHREGALASLGSPSDTLEMTADILDVAKEEKLLGSMLYLMTRQDSRPLCVTAQVTEITLRNRWHEQDTMRNVIKSRGMIPYFSDRQDVRSANLNVGAVFTLHDQAASPYWQSDSLGNVPATGTGFQRLSQDLLEELIDQYRRDCLYFGTAYGDDQIRMPIYLKHFGDPATGGQGEAYHSLIVGKTGSGKSTLAKMMLAGYSRHSSMGMLIIDPKGEFSDEIRGRQVGASGLPLAEIFAGQGRNARRYGISSIRLKSWDIWQEIAAASNLHMTLNIRQKDAREIFYEAVREICHQAPRVNLTDLHQEESLQRVLEVLADPDNGYAARIYKSATPQDNLHQQFVLAMNDANHLFRRRWRSIASLFMSQTRDGLERLSVEALVESLITNGQGAKPIIAIDLSAPGNEEEIALMLGNGEEDSFSISDSLQKRIIKYVVDTLVRTAERRVSQWNASGIRDNANCLVVFEEAHRYAPSQSPSDEEGKALRHKLIEGIRETRKFGLGWMFVDQTIGGLDKQITQQIRMAYFGFGLAMGSELDRLRELAGGDSKDLRLYQSFRDPASYGSNEMRKFPWMAVGPVSPMASNRPLFINAFSGEDFVHWNAIRRDAVSYTEAPRRVPTIPRSSKSNQKGRTSFQGTASPGGALDGINELKNLLD